MHRKLFFAADGATLLDIRPAQLVLWAMSSDQPHQYALLRGRFVGLSADGAHVLLQDDAQQIVAYETRRATPVDAFALAPEAFPAHQRLRVTLADAHTIELVDVFSDERRQVKVTYADISFGQSQLLPRTPDERYLLSHNSFFAGSDEGGSLACYDLVLGQQILSYGLRYCSRFDVAACPAQQAIAIAHDMRSVTIFDVGPSAGASIYHSPLWSMVGPAGAEIVAALCPNDRERCLVAQGSQALLLGQPAEPAGVGSGLRQLVPVGRAPSEWLQAMVLDRAEAGQPISCVAFDPAGQRAVAGLQDGSIRAWRVQDNSAFAL